MSPIPVTTRPRFKCQFCLSYRAILRAVEKHEGYCWQNPDRFCYNCDNTGVVTVDVNSIAEGIGGETTFPCHYCEKENKELTATLKQINAK